MIVGRKLDHGGRVTPPSSYTDHGVDLLSWVLEAILN